MKHLLLGILSSGLGFGAGNIRERKDGDIMKRRRGTP